MTPEIDGRAVRRFPSDASPGRGTRHGSREARRKDRRGDRNIGSARCSDRSIGWSTGDIRRRARRITSYSTPQRLRAICDEDGTQLIQRADDTPEAIATATGSLRSNDRAAFGLLRRSADVLRRVSGEQSIDDVTADDPRRDPNKPRLVNKRRLPMAVTIKNQREIELMRRAGGSLCR